MPDPVLVGLLDSGVADDLAAQKGAHIGAVGIGPALMQLPADGGTADPVAFFHDKHLQSGLRQIAGGGQAVVSGTGDDRVEFAEFLHLQPPVTARL